MNSTLSRSTLIGRVHARAKATGLLDDDKIYRDALESSTGKRSCADMDTEELKRVLVALGGSEYVVGRPPTRNKQDQHPNLKRTGTMHGKLARLMQHLGWNWKQTAGFCQRVTGKTDTRLCSSTELSKVITGMVAMIEQKLASREIILTAGELATFRKHTRHHSQSQETKP
ncbi:MAG: phage protein GemA/Gp16 family protein [Bacteroidota bacterium]